MLYILRGHIQQCAGKDLLRNTLQSSAIFYIILAVLCRLDLLGLLCLLNLLCVLSVLVWIKYNAVSEIVATTV